MVPTTIISAAFNCSRLCGGMSACKLAGKTENIIQTNNAGKTASTLNNFNILNNATTAIRARYPTRSDGRLKGSLNRIANSFGLVIGPLFGKRVHLTIW
jgi:hypothetical protein